MTWDGIERRQQRQLLGEFAANALDRLEANEELLAQLNVRLSEDNLKKIAKAAANEAFDVVYMEVGKNTVRAALYAVGAGLAALAVWLKLRS